MDKTVLKNFAIESRKDLMDKIDKKIKLFYIDEEFKKDNRGDVIVLSNDKHSLTLTKNEDENRDKLIRRIVELGYEQVVEEAAYTWFNRIIAIRYMEINDFLPLSDDNQSLGIRVLSSNDNEPIPEIMKFSNLTRKDLAIDFNLNKYNSLIREDEKFKYILLLVCKKLANLISPVFGGITDYIDLLIPDNMLLDNGFINNLLKNIPPSNFEKVEIIGWMYQYYNQTEKDKVISSKRAFKSYEIPYVTQLFTPDWIVKYLVENSLGRLMLEHLGDIDLRMNYYINDVIEKKETIKLEDIKILDPCCGSGHMLVYAFELLYKAYEALGYNKKDIVICILKNNLYGLDIDERAIQLTMLSILLKGREYDKNLFNSIKVDDLNVTVIEDTKWISKDVINFFPDKYHKDFEYLKNTFDNAKEIGSLQKVDYRDLSQLVEYCKKEYNIFTMQYLNRIYKINRQISMLTKKYDVVVTNPPYMNSSVMPIELKKYIQKHYPDSKTDLCTAFMEFSNIKADGYLAMINQHSWMFLGSFENLRKKIIDSKQIYTMIHLGTRAFEEIGGEVVQTTAFVLGNKKDKRDTIFIKLTDIPNAAEKEATYLKRISLNDYYKMDVTKMKEISSCPIAYWVSENIINAYKNGTPLENLSSPRQGMATSDNERFLRLWFEVNINKIGFNIPSSELSLSSNKKWFPYNKGGGYRKWYGNTEYIVNWENDGKEIKDFRDYKNSTLNSNMGVAGLPFIFKENITWSKISTNNFSVRYLPKGFLFDVSGCSIYANHDFLIKLIALLNSKVISSLLKVTSQTLNFEVGSIKMLPIIGLDNSNIEKIAMENIDLAKEEWDSFETSWDFKKHPLLLGNNRISSSLEIVKGKWDERFNKVKSNEKELNNIFINAYSLSNEIDNEINEKDITIRKVDKEREIKSLISYAVGCMFGRYSLDEDGLIFAGGQFEKSRYKKFVPDDDNIIPISDNENIYYNDDIVGKFKDFIKVAFGTEYFIENIDYIAEVLGKKGTESSEDTIRRYFVNDFFNDHAKTYQKRPIYWLFDSGKKNGFKCLIYLHRYDEQIVSKIRTKYLHNALSIYQRTVEEIDYKLNNEGLSITDKRELQNKKSDLNSKITECNEYEEIVGNVANKMVKIDLDDGVAINYEKFVGDNGKSILAKIK